MPSAGGEQGSGSESGQPGSGQGGSAADTGSSGSQGGSGSQQGSGAYGSDADLEAIFDGSLGDFDGDMQGERERIASTGQGSGQGAAGREAADAAQVEDAGTGGMGGFGDVGGGMEGGQAGSMGGGGTMGGSQQGSSTQGSASQGDNSDGASGQNAGEGQSDITYDSEGGDFDTSERDGANVADIPDDIPTDGTGEDQVAEQIREAAMAETDPQIRDALWDEYRRHMGIKKK